MCHDEDKVRRAVEGTTSLSGPADRGEYQLTRLVVAADTKGLVVLAFSGYMCAEVGFVIEWTFICRGEAISFGEFTVIELAVDEFEKGGPFLGVACEPFVKGLALCL